MKALQLTLREHIVEPCKERFRLGYKSAAAGIILKAVEDLSSLDIKMRQPGDDIFDETGHIFEQLLGPHVARVDCEALAQIFRNLRTVGKLSTLGEILPLLTPIRQSEVPPSRLDGGGPMGTSHQHARPPLQSRRTLQATEHRHSKRQGETDAVSRHRYLRKLFEDLKAPNLRKLDFLIVTIPSSPRAATSLLWQLWLGHWCTEAGSFAPGKTHNRV